MGNATLIEGLERVKNSFNSYPLDRVALAGATDAFEDKAYFDECCEKVIATRSVLTEALQKLGFEVLPSAANFVFARHSQHQAADLAAGLRSEEHTSELQSRPHLVCRLLLEKKKNSL